MWSLAAVLVLAIVALVYVSRQGGDVVAAGPPATAVGKTTTTTADPGGGQPGPAGQAPSTVAPVAPPVTRSGGVPPMAGQVDALVAQISTFVEKERGLTFKTKVEIELVADTEFAAKLKARLDEKKGDRIKTGRVLTALGVLDPKFNYEASMATLQSIGVVAFYDVTRRVLVIRAVQLTPYLKASVASELTRALDDAYFDLNRPKYAAELDEIGFGLEAVVAGDVERVKAAYVKAMSAPDQDQRKREEAQFVADNPAGNDPAILFELVRAPTALGGPFVQKVMEQGGPAEVGAAIVDPPRISTLLLHAERYFAHEQRVEVDKPKADGKQFAEGVFGEEMTRLLLANDADQTAADRAAAGWAGDWYVAWDDGRGGSCIRINFKMRTASDLDVFIKAMTTWVQGRGGRAQIERSPTPDLVQLTSCGSKNGAAQNGA